ncbi:MAG TPA: hypothetical protein VHL11_14045 [Phototrophicaceae bacterium]|jgi:hypothetical protein|nr:hypothetical protein [Phototrophicaceae bacterium]
MAPITRSTTSIFHIGKLNFSQLIANAKTQFNHIRFTLFVSGALALVAVLGVYSISMVGNIPLGELTRDPAAISDTPFYFGLLTYIDIMLWAAVTSICLMGAIMVGGDLEFRRTRLFFMFGAAFNLFLMLDDAFLLHETVFPKLGIHEKLIMLSYLVFIIGYIYYFMPEIQSSDYLLLGLAMGFLGISMGMDKFLPLSNLETFVEDSFKLFGIVFWLVYFARTVVNTVQSRFVH